MLSKPPTRIIGTGTNRSGLKVSHKPRHIYVGCLDPETEVVNVTDYVYKNIGVRVPCEKLQTRGTTYTSFKIKVDRSHVERIFEPSLWPEEAIIDYYKPPRSERRLNSRRYDDRNYSTRGYDSDQYYQREYNEKVYNDRDYNGYENTGRNYRYRRDSNGDY